MGTCASAPLVLASVVSEQPRDVEEKAYTSWTLELAESVEKHHFVDDYDVIRPLGVGSMGSVSLVRHRYSSRQKQLYTMKSIWMERVNKQVLQELREEIDVVRHFDHPSITKMHDVHFAEKRIHILMDGCSGGDLYQRKPYSESQAARIVKQVLSAVAYMHSEGYVHRDLKFENIMFVSPVSNHIKVIDFGLSCQYDPSRPLERQVGSIRTMAPERLFGACGPQCDLWSIGVVAFELISGRKPFDANDVDCLVRSIVDAQYRMDSRWNSKTRASVPFCRKLLQRDVLSRPTAEEALQHCWFREAAAETSPTEESDVEILDRDNVLEYSESPVLKTLVGLFAGHRRFPAEVHALRDKFHRYDTEGSDTILYSEFQAAVLSTTDDEDIEKLLRGFSPSEDCRKITYAGILAASLTAWGVVLEENICARFEHQNGSKISIKNLEALLGKEHSALRSVVIQEDITCGRLLQAVRCEVDQLAEFVLCGPTTKSVTL